MPRVTTDDLVRDVRALKIYAGATTLVIVLLIISGFARPDSQTRFDEIDVERINIVEADGQLRMVISNKERQHPGFVNGKLIEREYPRPPGMIFFNHVGDEMGGLVFDENGDTGQFAQLSFDKFRNDQTIGFRHMESSNGSYVSGLVVWQQPNIPSDVVAERYGEARSIPDEGERAAAIQAMRDAGELTAERVFVGKYRDDTALLLLSDKAGNPRLRIQVAEDGSPSMEFLDADGQVTSRLPAD